jgi:formylglycine-generating enzyme required for sulfatase activity
MGALGRYVKNGGSYTAENVHSSTGGTARVGSYQPNAWGIYDMHGNLREWCLDWLGEYPQAAAVAPTGPASGTSRTVRGGGYSDGPYSCRSANRGSASSKTVWAQLGFRLAADILPEGEAEAGAEE